MRFSLITTVKNEQETINDFLESLSAQSKTPDEIVIVDGMSSDQTLQKIKSFKKLNIKIIEEKSNIAKGRNIAIRNTANDFIVVTDVGCTLKVDWFEKITSFGRENDVVVGNYKPIIQSIFDACQYSIMGLFKSNKKDEDFVISSRSLAFRKRVWEELGGYPEWLNYSEDMYFHNQIKRANYRVKYAKEAFVEWRQRKTLKQIFKQFFLYMEGDGMAKMHTTRHLIRFLTYFTAVLLVILGLGNPLYLLLIVGGFLLYLSVPYSNFIRLKKYSLFTSALFIIPFLLIYSDVAKMAGYVSGVLKGTKERNLLDTSD